MGKRKSESSKGNRQPFLSDQANVSDSYGTIQSTGSGKSQYGFVGSTKENAVAMGRTLGIHTAILIMINGCLGTGIFVSPVGVTEQVGSVGLTLIIWTFCGLFTIVLALCYAELGTAIPLAGGDYAYIVTILGHFPAFLCLWIMVALIGPCATGMMAQIGSLYFSTMFGIDESNMILPLIFSVFLHLSCATLNMVSVQWAARISNLFSVAKLVAMGTIIAAGLVKLSQGYTSNLSAANVWQGSDYSPSAILFSLVPGLVSFGGWDGINAMAEEMKNPKRDIPIVAGVGLMTVTSIYIMVNVAYFSVLNPIEFIQSDVAAMSFATRALPGISWIIPLFVVVSSVGSMIATYMFYPRFAFSGGQNGQMPAICSYIHIKYLTPMPSIILLIILSIFFNILGLLFNIEAIVNMLSFFALFKYALSLIALIYMKTRSKDLKGTITIPLPVVVLCLVILFLVAICSVYSDPLVMGVAICLLVLGIPLYFLQRCVNTQNTCCKHVTVFLQKLLLVVPVKNSHQG